mmetsp:Transcript_11715/g.17881  ORF Transcript_11715/g.17881 Transcript_11715/m.17881 type:complete len:180 (+) Transcript_11715:1042-1581(+)
MIGEYPLIDELKIQIKPYDELWNLQVQTIQKQKMWIKGPLKDLEPDEVEADFKKMYGLANKLTVRFEQNKLNKPQGVSLKIKEELEKFKQFVPIIRALCNPGLQQRHIDMIFQLIKTTMQKGDKLQDMKLEFFQQFKIENFRDSLEEISDKASKEFSNQRTMLKMKDEWGPLEFTCVEA